MVLHYLHLQVQEAKKAMQWVMSFGLKLITISALEIMMARHRSGGVLTLNQIGNK
jgi:hypothetical protein